MSRRHLVKDAIAHRTTDRAPYRIDFTREARLLFEQETGSRSAEEFLDNDVIEIHPPWWSWDNLGPEWREMNAPSVLPGVAGRGSYDDFVDELRMLRDRAGSCLQARRQSRRMLIIGDGGRRRCVRPPLGLAALLVFRPAMSLGSSGVRLRRCRIVA